MCGSLSRSFSTPRLLKFSNCSWQLIVSISFYFYFLNPSHFCSVWSTLATMWFHNCNASIIRWLILPPNSKSQNSTSGKESDNMAAFHWPNIKRGKWLGTCWLGAWQKLLVSSVISIEYKAYQRKQIIGSHCVSPGKYNANFCNFRIHSDCSANCSELTFRGCVIHCKKENTVQQKRPRKNLEI